MLRSNTVTLLAGCLLIVSSLLAWNADYCQAEPLSLGNIKAEGNAGTPRPELQDAARKFQERDYDAALELLEAAKRQDNSLPPAEIMMARFAGAARQVDLLQKWLDKAAQAHPDDPQAYVAMAELALQGGQFTQADVLIAKAKSLLANFKGTEKRQKEIQKSIAAGLATIAQSRKDWQGAKAQLDGILAIDPKDVGALRRLAMLLCQQGQQEAALEKLQEIAKIKKDFLTPEAVLAQDCQRIDDSESAGKWMVAALQKNPKDFRTRLAAARWALQNEQFDQAMDQAAFAEQLDTNSIEAKILQGNAALFLKDYAKAANLFGQALSQAPGNFSITNNLALALCEQSDPAKRKLAFQYAQMNARMYPRQAEAASTLGWVYYKLGQLDQAEKTLRMAAASGSLSPDTAYYIARVSADKGNAKEARALLERVLKVKGLFSQRAEAQALLQQLSR